jgi:predicted MFS family arabinose efflux permease
MSDVRGSATSFKSQGQLIESQQGSLYSATRPSSSLLSQDVDGQIHGDKPCQGNHGDCLSTSHTTRHESAETEVRRLHSISKQSSTSVVSAPHLKENKTHGDDQPVTWLSLPHKSQLFILAFCRLSEPLSNTCLLPYLYYLIRSLQSPTSRTAGSISRQAGLLVSLFALSQFATSMPWAYAANRYGRKPTILIGLILSIIANLGFGFSTSVPAVMCWRVVAGVGNGNIGVMRTMTAEIVKEKKYQSRAFLLLPLVFNSGVVIGLALGGCLADPVINLPWLFGPKGVLNLVHDSEGVAWMREYPYALPTIFNAGVLTCSLLLAVGGLKETMAGKGKNDYGLILGKVMRRIAKRVFFGARVAGYVAVESDDMDGCERGLLDQDSPNPPSTRQSSYGTPSPKSTWTRDVLATLVSFTLLPLHNAAFMQVFPVFLSTPQSSTTSFIFFTGGLGLPSSTIGLFLSGFGIFGILIQLIVYPRLQAAIGTLWAYRLALSIFPFAYILAPYLSFTSSHEILRSFGIALILFLQVTARTFAIPSSVILLTNSTPTPKALSTVHGAGNMLSSLSRAVGPLVGGLVFAWGVDIGVVGMVWWLYLTATACLGLLWSWTLKEGEGFAKRSKEEVELMFTKTTEGIIKDEKDKGTQ